MKITSQPISRNELNEMLPGYFGDNSLINIRPYQGNRSRDVQDPAIRKRIVEVVNTLIK